MLVLHRICFNIMFLYALGSSWRNIFKCTGIFWIQILNHFINKYIIFLWCFGIEKYYHQEFIIIKVLAWRVYNYKTGAIKWSCKQKWCHQVIMQTKVVPSSDHANKSAAIKRSCKQKWCHQEIMQTIVVPSRDQTNKSGAVKRSS